MKKTKAVPSAAPEASTAGAKERTSEQPETAVIRRRKGVMKQVCDFYRMYAEIDGPVRPHYLL
jgi:hypothetical protein